MIGDWEYVRLARARVEDASASSVRLRRRLGEMPVGVAYAWRDRVWRRWARRFKTAAERAVVNEKDELAKLRAEVARLRMAAQHAVDLLNGLPVSDAIRAERLLEDALAREDGES